MIRDRLTPDVDPSRIRRPEDFQRDPEPDTAPRTRGPHRERGRWSDHAEAFANAALGLLVSIAAVHALRAAGAWADMPAWAVAGVFFALSLARARALRFIFRKAEASRNA